MVKFGVHHGANAPFQKFTIPDIVKSSILADELGYDSVWIMDHLNWTPLTAKTQIQDPFILLAYLADKVKNATLGTCVTDPHRRHPAQTALTALTLQDLTNGRFILGIGAGEAANLVDFGIPWNKPVTRLKEVAQIIKLLWDSTIRKTVNFKGEFFNLNNAGLQFKVSEQPKLYLAANSPKTIQFTGEIADGWIPANVSPTLYEKQLHLLEQNPRASEIEKCVEIWISVSNDKPDFAKKVTRTVASVLTARKEILSIHGIDVPAELELETLYNEPIKGHVKKQQDIMDFISKNVPEEIIESIVIGGSSAEAIEQIDGFVKAGVEHFIFEFIGDYFESMKLFSEKVMPHFK